MSDIYSTFAPPGHFYSPVPQLEDAEKHLARVASEKVMPLAGIELDAEIQFEQLAVMTASHLSEFLYPESASEADGPRYYLKNGFFGDGDAFLLHAMLRQKRPSRVIEVGSGFSSALILDTVEHLNLDCRVTFIEPYPDRLQRLLRSRDGERCQVIQAPVQNLPAEFFSDLGTNDILFIDSSHVSKTGSDVNHLYFNVIPQLPTGVCIHIHDIFWPFEYPLRWHREGRAWNECYLLRALLINNPTIKVELFPDYLKSVDPNRLTTLSPPHSRNSGGSIWLQKRAPK